MNLKRRSLSGLGGAIGFMLPIGQGEFIGAAYVMPILSKKGFLSLKFNPTAIDEETLYYELDESSIDPEIKEELVNYFKERKCTLEVREE